ncbi:MAG: hypothetical protein Q4G02_01375 [bacterium]|nr:hypothetical protein [bacterium]
MIRAIYDSRCASGYTDYKYYCLTTDGKHLYNPDGQAMIFNYRQTGSTYGGKAQYHYFYNNSSDWDFNVWACGGSSNGITATVCYETGNAHNCPSGYSDVGSCQRYYVVACSRATGNGATPWKPCDNYCSNCASYCKKNCVSSKTCASYTDYTLTNAQANSQCTYGSTSATKSNGCTNSLTCYKCKTCTPKTCATLGTGYYATAPSTSVCQYGYDYGAYSDGCNGSLGCYTCKTCTTCESITSDGGGWLTNPPTCTEAGGYTSQAFSNLCNGGTVCYKKGIAKTCASYTDYPLTANQVATECTKYGGGYGIAKSDGCTSDGLTCYKCNDCEKQGYETRLNCSNNFFSPNGKFGWKNGVEETCGTCVPASESRYQGVGGNIFAQRSIELDLNSSLDLPNNYLIRKNGDWDDNPSNNSGLAMTYTGGLNLVNANVTQRRDSSNTKATGTQGYPANRKEDFAYFKNLIDYSQVRNCNDSALSNFKPINDSDVCKITNPNLLSQNLTIGENTKKVVFVEGDLNITRPIEVPASSYLAIIASGTITFQPNLGEDITTLTNSVADITGNKGLNQAATINGVFIANELDFPHTTDASLCDKKLTLGGTFVGWGSPLVDHKGITMSRNFKECYAADGTYIDYNKNYNTLTFKYRPEFVLNTPSWMKRVTELTLESN